MFVSVCMFVCVKGNLDIYITLIPLSSIFWGKALGYIFHFANFFPEISACFVLLYKLPSRVMFIPVLPVRCQLFFNMEPS